MKTTSPRTWFGFILVIAATILFVTASQWLLASPANEIAKAVASGGNPDVKKASGPDFIDAFASVLVQTDHGHSASYVAAAQQMRPDLSNEIAAAASDMEAETDDATNDEDQRVSQHRRKCKVCHHGHTIVLPCSQVPKFLEHHPEDTRGPCTPTPTPTPRPH
jgi:hypothetical protein